MSARWILGAVAVLSAAVGAGAAAAACGGGDVIIGIEAHGDDAGPIATQSSSGPVPSLSGPDGSLPTPDADTFDAYAGPCATDGACPTGSSCDYDAAVPECFSHSGPPVPPPGG